MNNKLSVFHSTIQSGYYPVLFILSLLWMAYYNPGMGSIATVSFIAQQTTIFTLLHIADSLFSSKKIRYALAGGSSLYVFLLHFNAFLISITSMTLYESLTVLAIGGDFLYTLEEAGLSVIFIILFVLLTALICSAGSAAYRYMPRAESKKISAGFIPVVIFTCSAFFFIGEQIYSRNSTDFFSRRLYPLYIEIFSSNSGTESFTIPENPHPEINHFRQVTAAGNAKNVLFIILESFRSDSVCSALAPFMKELSENSMQLPNYYTDAIYTSLAWNTLLMDRPAYTLSSDIDYDSMHESGSVIFRIFRNAGYTTYAAFSANMEWKNFHKRVSGKDLLIDSYVPGYEKRGEERNIIDNRLSTAAAEWIKNRDSRKPFFMLLQLDSSHWTYYADSENRISKPFSGKDVNIGKLRNPADIELLYNRYKNSVRQIDSVIKKIITSLKESGRYDNTAIVIVSDHGEGFAPGMIGHSVLHDDIKKPAIIMRLPGIEKFRTDSFVSHSDIFPTLFDYLKIRNTGKITRGRSILEKDFSRRAHLAFHGSIMMADLTFRDYTVFFRVKISDSLITFTPVKHTDSSGNTIESRDSSEWKAALKDIIENSRPL